MTSGQFHSLPLSSIKADREGRQRRGPDEIPILAESISRLGLIQPIVVTRSFDLVAGERRLEACRLLGHTHISAQYVDEVEEHPLRAIELEENIKRSQLPWQDECRAVYEYYQIRRAETPGFSQEDLGLALGLGQPTVSNHISVAKELLAGQP